MKQAKDRVLSEDFALRQAVESDASRQWAWRSLFLIFGVINFAVTFAIGRERFDRGVNRLKYRRSLLRLFRPAAGA